MDENLAGYLLDSLDPETHQQVERYLRDHPEAQQRLDRMRHTLALLAEDREDFQTPPDLRFMTLSRVAEFHCRTLPQAPKPSRSQVMPRRSWWRRADVAVAAALLITITGIAVPQIVGAWQRYQVTACQNNLRQFHAALVAYGDSHNGEFPKVEARPPRDFAGVFIPILNESGLLPHDISVGCPANGKHPPCGTSLSELEEMQRRPDRQNEYQQLTCDMAGCYAYSLGYCETVNGVKTHFGLRLNSGDFLPILADKPPPSEAGGCHPGNSPNHGGRGQNVLFIGGNVVYSTSRTIGFDNDDIYSNQEKRPYAGLGPYDTVLAPSGARPYPPSDP